jgi:hypothetical protein
MEVFVLPKGPFFGAFSEQATLGTSESRALAITEKTAATRKTAFLTQKRGNHMDSGEYIRICHVPEGRLLGEFR